ncbi:MAG: NlpC/P60 family protein [Filifactoraceae bacterium]
MKWFRVATVSLIMPCLFTTISFAELQAFVKTEKAYVREGEDYSSKIATELKSGDRIEVLETTAPLLVNPNGKKGYMTNSQVSLYSIKKSGDVVLGKDIKINTNKGVEVIKKGVSLPVYDYSNEHYMIKKNGFYYFIHETTVDKKPTGIIEKPILLTEEIFGKNESSENGLGDLFNEMDTTLSEYQNQVKTEEVAAEVSLLEKVATEKIEKKQVKKEADATTTAKLTTKPVGMTNANIDAYKNIPIIEKGLNELGKPYVWGAIGPSSYDCSGFTYSIHQAMGVKIPRVSADQSKSGILVEKENLKAGDLIFFDTRAVNNLEDITDNPNVSNVVGDVNVSIDNKSESSNIKKFVPTKVTHVGMYIGDGYFIHASSGEGKVVIQSLDISYYNDRYLLARRYI